MTPQDIQNKRFDKGIGGYKAEDVEAFLAQVADYVHDIQREKDELEKKMLVIAEKLEEYREDEQSLRAALIGAQKLGDSVVRDAKKKADEILAEADAKAKILIADAKSSIDRETVSLSRMQGEVASFKTQILDMYRRQIELIETGALEKKLSPAAVKAIRSLPPNQEAQAQNQEVKAMEFNLNFKEEDDPEIEPDEPASKQTPKRSNYGELRFGDEHRLTRKD